MSAVSSRDGLGSILNASATRGPAVALHRRNVLFLAYFFPPLGGPGVQRSLKTVKYLPEHGWDPIVLTVKDILYYVHDPELAAEIPPTARVVPTESFDPLRIGHLVRELRAGGEAARPLSITTNSSAVNAYRALRDFLTFPDAHAGWIPFAVRRGLQLIRSHRIPVIYTAGAPYSSTVAAYLLSRASGVPYVVDFRDGWTDDQYQNYPTSIHLQAHRALERLVVTNAAAVVTVVPSLTQQLAQRYPELGGRVSTITNGFDPADMNRVTPVARGKGVRRIVYSGSMHEHHKANFVALLDALHGLDSATQARLEILFVGTTFEGSQDLVDRAGLSKQVRFLGYQPHSIALDYLASADATLLFVRPGDRDSVTGKVFEYLMVGRPVLAGVESGGQCANILESAGFSEWRYDPASGSQLAAHIRELVRRDWPAPARSSASPFSRRTHAAAFARIFESAARTPRTVTPE